MILPRNDYVLLEMEAESEVTKGGIILAPTAIEKTNFGIVKAAPKECGLEFGMKVIYNKYAGTEIKTEDKKDALLIKQEEIIAIIS